MNKIILSATYISALAFVACTDMDIEPEGLYVTEEARNEATGAMATRGEAELTGAFSRAWLPGSAMGATAYNDYAYPDDGGYPTVCFMFDLGTADICAPNSGYNWYSSSLLWNDRNASFRNPNIRWRIFYAQIKAANDIIAARDPQTASAADLNTLGQALALRAFDYLNLAPYYAFDYAQHPDDPCVPLVTDTNADEKAYARSTVKEVYTQIIDDLTNAINYLDGYTRTASNFIDKGVAYGLRARAYLAMEKWVEAAADAKAALENVTGTCDGTPYSIDEISKPSFCNISDHNWMWGIRLSDSMIDGEYASWPSWIGSFSTNAYSVATGTYAMINQNLFDKIPDTDARKGWWVDADLHSDHLDGFTWQGFTGDAIASAEVEDVKVAYLPYTNIKFGFQSGADLAKNGGDWCLMRVEEMLLIQAEALAKSGADGQSVLTNFMKTYRDANYSPVFSKFEDEIWFQRRVELWGEGFAYADLMRLRKNMVRFHAGQEEDINVPTTAQFNIPAGDKRLLMVIPQTEINANPLIVQNETSTPKAGENSGLTDGITD